MTNGNCSAVSSELDQAEDRPRNKEHGCESEQF